MIRILGLLVLSMIYGHALGPDDKFDLSLTSVALKGNTLEIDLKISNLSTTPVKIDLAMEALVLRAAAEPPSPQAQSVDTRADIYKPRVVILVPEGESMLFPSKTSRLFAPGTLAPGASLTLTKTVSVTPANFLKDAAKTPYEIFANLAYRTADKPDCQIAAPSPAYKIIIGADGNPALSPK